MSECCRLPVAAMCLDQSTAYWVRPASTISAGSPTLARSPFMSRKNSSTMLLTAGAVVVVVGGAVVGGLVVVVVVGAVVVVLVGGVGSKVHAGPVVSTGGLVVIVVVVVGGKGSVHANTTRTAMVNALLATPSFYSATAHRPDCAYGGARGGPFVLGCRGSERSERGRPPIGKGTAPSYGHVGSVPLSWVAAVQYHMPGTSVKDAFATRRKRDALAKSLSSAFGSRSKRKAQLISRLKRRRKYPAPVKGGTGKQSRHRAN